jgi:hypothetical protein
VIISSLSVPEKLMEKERRGNKNWNKRRSGAGLNRILLLDQLISYLPLEAPFQAYLNDRCFSARQGPRVQVKGTGVEATRTYLDLT